MNYWKPASVVAAVAMLASCGAEPTQAPDKAVRSTTYSVSIAGPTVVEDGQTCGWYAEPSGGVPPYSYVWSTETGEISDESSDSSIEYAFENGPHFLRVRMTDVNRSTVQTTISVWSYNGGGNCT